MFLELSWYLSSAPLCLAQTVIALAIRTRRLKASQHSRREFGPVTLPVVIGEVAGAAELGQGDLARLPRVSRVVAVGGVVGLDVGGAGGRGDFR